MNQNQNAVMMCTSTAHAGPDINMEELQQRLAKLRNLSGTPPLVSQQPDSTAQSTPVQVKGQRHRPAHLHEPADSGYSSVAPSPDTQKAEFVGQDLPGTKLKYFNQTIPGRLKDRYFDIKVLYTQALHDFVAKKRRNAGDIAMKLKYLGLTEQSTEPYIIVQCEKKTAKIIKKFFNQSHIQEELEPDFRVLVLDKELMRLGDDDPINVYANALPDKTWCGTPITMTRHDACTVSATLGGIVAVEDTAGRKLMYGLTASHPLSKLKSTGLLSPDATDSESDFSDTESEASVEASDLSGLKLSESYEQPEDEVAVKSSSFIGAIVHHTLDDLVHGNFDWALVEFGSINPLPNMIFINGGSSSSPEPTKRQGSASNEPGRLNGHGWMQLWDGPSTYRDSASKPVSVITRRGPQAATLTLNTSSVLIAPGQKFVESHDLSMRPMKSLEPGDSGSWVVDESTGEVFGYVISIDLFREAQVMPLELVLADIKDKLGAAYVFLPGPADITPQKDEPKERNDLHPSFTLPWERAGLADRLRQINDVHHVLDPRAEPWTPDSQAVRPPRSSTRSRSVGSRPLESQDASRSAVYIPWDRTNPRLPVIGSSSPAGRRGPPSTASRRHQDTQPQRHYSRPTYEGYDVHGDTYSRPPVVVTRRPSSRRIEVSDFGMPRFGDMGAMVPPQQQYFMPHGQPMPQLGSMPWPQMIAGNTPANDQHMGFMAYSMTMGKNGTDSGYASRTSSHQASPVPSPPQPSTAHSSQSRRSRTTFYG